MHATKFQTYFKAFTDYKSDVAQLVEVDYKRVQKIVGKGGNAAYCLYSFCRSVFKRLFLFHCQVIYIL